MTGLPTDMSRALHERLDPFGLAVGGWVAATSVPAAAFLAHRQFGWGVEALALFVLVGGPVVAVAVWPLVPSDLAVRLASRRRHSLAFASPFAFLVLPVAAVVLGLDPSAVAVALSLVAGLGGLFAGLAVWAGANTRYAKAMTDEATVLATWSARPDMARRTQLRWLTAALAVVGVGIAAAALVVDPSLLALLGGVVGGAIPLHQVRERPREFTATAAGLAVHTRGTVVIRFEPWSRFRGFSRTADSLVLHRRWWPSVRCAVADLDDPDEVTYALDRHLDRLGA